MTDPVIIKDTINVSPAYDDVFYVSAMVTATTREEGVYVQTMWNSSAGSDVARQALIAAYNDTFTNPAVILTAQLKTAIGTEMAAVEPTPTDPNVTINAASVTVNQVTP